MGPLIQQIRHSRFLRHNAVLFFGSLAVGFLNYLYYPILGRLLIPRTFGEVQVLASLLAQTFIFLNVFGLITVNIVTNYVDLDKRNRLIMELERLAMLVGILLLIATMMGSVALQYFFRFDSAVPFPLLVLAIVVSVPLAFRMGYLRGLRRFGLGIWIGMIGSAVDLVLAALFVLFGWSTNGVMIALVFGQLSAFGLAVIFTRREGFSESLRGSMLRLPDLRLIFPELKYAGLVLMASLAITGFYSIDTIVVKHYFDVHTAGLYAGISTIARIVYFLTSPVVIVLLPLVKLHNTPDQNRQVLLKSLALIFLLGGASLAGFSLLPRLTINILMGHTYLPYANLLPKLSLVIFIVSLLNLFITYYLALRRYWIWGAVTLGGIMTLLLLQMHHNSLTAVIDSLLYGSLGTMVLLGGFSLTWQRIKKSNI